MEQATLEPPAATANRLVHALIAAVVFFSLGIQLVLIFTAGADANSGESGATASTGVRLVRLFSFFTVESNLIVGAVAILLVLQPSRDRPRWRVARFDSLLGIIVTGLVFAIVLAPQVHLTGWALVASIGFHYISPGLTLLAWLLFGPRRRFTPATVLFAFVWPTLWLLYTFVRGEIVNWYPYPFLDADRLGLGHAIRNSLGVVLLAAGLSAALYLVDRLAPALTVEADPHATDPVAGR